MRTNIQFEIWIEIRLDSPLQFKVYSLPVHTLWENSFPPTHPTKCRISSAINEACLSLIATLAVKGRAGKNKKINTSKARSKWRCLVTPSCRKRNPLESFKFIYDTFWNANWCTPEHTFHYWEKLTNFIMWHPRVIHIFQGTWHNLTKCFIAHGDKALYLNLVHSTSN